MSKQPIADRERGKTDIGAQTDLQDFAVDQAKLTRAMGLEDGQFVTFAQTVGYPST